MKKLLASKKGVNDISILAVILSVYIMTATLLPPVASSLEESTDVFNASTYANSINQDADSVNRLSAFTIITTVGKLASFDLGNSLDLPFWFKAVYFIMAIIFIMIIARNIWVGGGG